MNLEDFNNLDISSCIISSPTSNSYNEYWEQEGNDKIKKILRNYNEAIEEASNHYLI